MFWRNRISRWATLRSAPDPQIAETARRQGGPVAGSGRSSADDARISCERLMLASPNGQPAQYFTVLAASRCVKARRSRASKVQGSDREPLPAPPIAHVDTHGHLPCCASKWMNRWRQLGELGLLDRSSILHQARRRPPDIIEGMETWRRTVRADHRRIDPADLVLGCVRSRTVRSLDSHPEIPIEHEPPCRPC